MNWASEAARCYGLNQRLVYELLEPYKHSFNIKVGKID